MNRFFNKFSLFKALYSSGKRLFYPGSAFLILIFLLTVPVSAFDEPDRFIAEPEKGNATPTDPPTTDPPTTDPPTTDPPTTDPPTTDPPTTDPPTTDPPPPLEFAVDTAPKRGIAPLEVTFSVLRGRGAFPFIHNYTFGDNTPPATEAPPYMVHLYTEPGSYEAVIEVTDAKGSTGKIVITIDVVTETSVTDRVGELENEQLPPIDGLEGFDGVMTLAIQGGLVL